jgi:hypothetical protein
MTTFTGQVSQSSDDAAQLGSGGTASIVVTTVNINSKVSTNFELSGFRWQNVTIPNAAVISSAIVSLNFALAVNTGDNHLDCQAADNAATFAATAANLGSGTRPLTGNTVEFNTALITSSGFQPIPALTVPVQAVISRAGWITGNSLVAISTSNSTTGNTCTVNMWDLSAADGAEISITYASGFTGWFGHSI